MSLSAREIAEHLDVAITTIYRELCEHGIKPNEGNEGNDQMHKAWLAESLASDALEQAVDLLAENPARWVGEIGCQILVDIVTGVAVAKVAERVLDFINTKRRDVGDNDPDAHDPDVHPRDPEQRNYEEDTAGITICANSFAAGGLLQRVDSFIQNRWMVGRRLRSSSVTSD